MKSRTKNFSENLFHFPEVIVGVNKYRLAHEDKVDVLVVDNSKVLHSQMDKLKALKKERNQDEVRLKSEFSCFGSVCPV